MKKIFLLALAFALSSTAQASVNWYGASSANSNESYWIAADTGSAADYAYATLYKNSVPVAYADASNYNYLSVGYSTTDSGSQTVNYSAEFTFDYWWGGQSHENGSASVTINVPNSAPTITWVQNPSNVGVNQWFNIQARGNDADGNLVAVRVSKEGVPFAFHDGGNGYENYTNANGASLDHSGTITFMAEAEDRTGAVSGPIYHVVTVSNNAPTISGSAPSIFIGQTATVSWSAGDPDGNLSYVQVWVTQWGSPYWDYLGSGGASGSMSWSSSAHFNSANPASGAYLFVVRAVDAEGADTYAYPTFDVINRPPDTPAISSGGVTQINLGQSVAISGTLHDPDGNLSGHNLFYAAPGGSWVGLLSGNPSNGTNSSLSTTFTPTAVGAWQFRSAGYDPFASGSDATLWVTVVDATPPSVPAGLSASAITATSFTLNWSASSDNVGVTLYDVRRNGQSIGTTAGTSMAVSALTQGTAYTMSVAAKDAAGNWSALSTGLVVTTTDTQAPTVPGGLAASSVTSTSFTLSWAASTDNLSVTAYEVVRDSGAPVSTAGTSLSITGLSQGVSYSMKVHARDAQGNWSDWSNALVVTTTDTQAPSVPSGLAASSVAASGFTLTWTASTDNVGVTAYEVKKDAVLLSPLATGTSFNLTGLSPSTTYAMAVHARDAAGNWSAWSTALNVTTSPPNSTTDTDGDGVPDVIEQQLGTNANSARQNDAANQSTLKIHRPNP